MEDLSFIMQSVIYKSEGLFMGEIGEMSCVVVLWFMSLSSFSFNYWMVLNTFCFYYWYLTSVLLLFIYGRLYPMSLSWFASFIFLIFTIYLTLAPIFVILLRDFLFSEMSMVGLPDCTLIWGEKKLCSFVINLLPPLVMGLHAYA